jgi:hypothetical protein
MKVGDFAQKLNMKILTGEAGLDKIITGIYICDLLSWVMSHAQTGNAWITVLTNLNIVAVAMMAEVSCIIIPEDIKIEEATLNKAIQEGVAVLATSLNSYKISCKAFGVI